MTDQFNLARSAAGKAIAEHVEYISVADRGLAVDAALSAFERAGWKLEKQQPKWGKFLDARADVIVEFAEEGRTDEDIARFLSMDEAQVKGIREWRQTVAISL